MDQQEIDKIRRELEKDLEEKRKRDKIRNKQRLFLIGVSSVLLSPVPSMFLSDSMKIYGAIYGIFLVIGGLVGIAISTEWGDDFPFNV